MKLALLCAAAMTAVTFTSCDKGGESGDDTTCKVTFNSQGGSAVAAKTVDKGDKVARPSANPTKEGYYFLDWFKEAACTNAWNFDADVVNSDITLYAGWTQTTTHTVTFNPNGGSAVAPQQVIDGGHATRPVPPTNPPMAFGGWFTDNGTFANAFNFSSTAITADITLYAKWTGVDIEALRTLITEAGSLNSNRYTSASYGALNEALSNAYTVAYHTPEPTEAQITDAFAALTAAMAGLVERPYAAATAISCSPAPVDGVIYLTPDQGFDLYARAVTADGNDATNPNVIFQITAPAWMEIVSYGTYNFSAYVSESAPSGATATMTIVSEDNPSVSLSVTLRVIVAGELRSRFIAAVDALPAPAGITYSHGDDVEAASDLYDLLSWNDKQDPAVIAAINKLEACEDTLYDLPQRYKYTFSGNTATLRLIDWDGTPMDDESISLSYEQNGNFPCGTFTQVGWFGEYGDYYQSKLVLKADGTIEIYSREADDQNGANATSWELENTGTYTNNGSKAAGGTLSLDFDYEEDEGGEYDPPVRSGAKPAAKSVSSFMIRR